MVVVLGLKVFITVVMVASGTRPLHGMETTVRLPPELDEAVVELLDEELDDETLEEDETLDEEVTDALDETLVEELVLDALLVEEALVVADVLVAFEEVAVDVCAAVFVVDVAAPPAPPEPELSPQAERSAKRVIDEPSRATGRSGMRDSCAGHGPGASGVSLPGRWPEGLPRATIPARSR